MSSKNTIFIFRAKYSDNRNQPPMIHKVRIDKNGDGDFNDAGEAGDMRPEGDDFVNGVIYTYTTSIPYCMSPKGISYYFEFSDGLHKATGQIPAGYSPETAISSPAVNQTLSISVSPETWDIGEVEVDTITTMEEDDKVVVLNNGDGRQDLALSLINPHNWEADIEPGEETFTLNAAFSEDVNNIRWDESNHLVTTQATTSTITRFAGDQHGAGVLPNKTRGIFLQFKSPTQTETIDTESITLTISCEVSHE